MKIYIEKLEQNLKILKPVYIISGDEPLQKIEAADKIRAFAKSQNILERQILEESGDSNPLTNQAGTMSLFAETRLLEWRFEKSIKKAFGDYIQEFLESGSQDVLLIIAPKLSNEKRAAWYKTVEKMGIAIEIWPRNVTDSRLLSTRRNSLRERQRRRAKTWVHLIVASG